MLWLKRFWSWLCEAASHHPLLNLDGTYATPNDIAADAALKLALEAARAHRMTPEEQREQRISFAYGNANIDNPRVTREMVEQASEEA